MASRSRPLLPLLLALLLLAAAAAAAAQPAKILGAGDRALDDDDEDLRFLEEDDDDSGGRQPSAPLFQDGEFDDVPELVQTGSHEDEPVEPEPMEPVDESDVVVLGGGNFSDFIGARRHVMVEFYAPWCGHCQALAPEYAAAATALKEEGVALAKVDATVENELAERFEVQGFPTILFFSDGAHKAYTGQRTKDGIVAWIKKKIGPGVTNITSVEEAEKILTSENKVVLAYLDSLVGSDSEELAAASKLEDAINFYQTTDSDVAKLFHIDPSAKRPSLVLLKKEPEKISYFDGKFMKSAISEFVVANKLPLVTTLTRESASEIFDNQIKNMILLFALSNETENVVPIFQEAAKSFKNKLICVYVERDEGDIGIPVSDYFGVTGDGPQVVAYLGEEQKKFFHDGELTVESIKKFGEDFLKGKLKPFYRSGPIPETNDGDVKIVVGKTFEEIVLDESKDVLLEIYAPWCRHCMELEPIYNKLAKHLRGIESLVLAKMDGTLNEHPRAMADGFPTLLFFPAGKKSSDPINVDTERTAVALYKFIKKHAAIPFKIERPPEEKKAAASASEEISSSELKDEL